jgi:tetratricopeptide (TPR) repeat protein
MDQAFLSDALTQQGITNLQKGDWSAAIFLFTQAIHHNSHAVSAYANRSTAYYSQGNYALALNDLSRALELVPDHYVFYLNRSIIYNKMGNGDRATADFEQAMHLNPQNFMIQFSQSMMLLSPGQIHADSPLSFSSVTPTPMKVARGKFQRNLSELCMSVYKFCDQMELQPSAETSDQVRNDILDLLLRLYQHAIQQNQNSLFIRDSVLLYWDRSCLLMDAQRLEQAIADLDQAIALSPCNAVLWLNRGIAYYTDLDYDKALINFSHVLALNPKMLQAYINRAIVYIAMNRLQEAKTDIDYALQINPEQETLLQLKANLTPLIG